MEHENYMSVSGPSSARKVRFHDGSYNVIQEVRNVILVTVFGSHLYGTEDENSDLDVKGVFIPTYEDLVLNSSSQTTQFSMGDSVGMEAGELDGELIDVRKFIKDALQGQTYAVEMLHCPKDKRLLCTEYAEDLYRYRDKLISDNVKPFLGYCYSQAQKYSKKGERLNELREIRDILSEYDDKQYVKAAFEEIEFDEYSYVARPKKQIHGSSAKKVELLEVGPKQYNLKSHIGEALKSIDKMIDKYGSRTQAASKDEIDWKAVYHAYRVASELEHLLTTGRIEFPLDSRDFLKQIKHGEVDPEKIQDDLSEYIEEVSSLESDLSTEPDRNYWNEWLVETFREVHDVE